MNKWIIAFIIAVLLGGVYFFLGPFSGVVRVEVNKGDVSQSEKTTDTSEVVQNSLPSGSGAESDDIVANTVVRRTDVGYEPKEITIKVGQVVSFINETDRSHWPASSFHPTHQVYPEFDSRKPIGPGETWSFIFTQGGEWKFHDHLSANTRGSVTVLPSVEE